MLTELYTITKMLERRIRHTNLRLCKIEDILNDTIPHPEPTLCIHGCIRDKESYLAKGNKFCRDCGEGLR